MALDINHNILEIQGSNEPWARLVIPPECFNCILLMEVLQQINLENWLQSIQQLH